jgi:hypothetical protein
MTDGASPSLEQVLEEVAATLEDAEAGASVGGGTEWSIDGRVFATVAAGRAEFRLDPMVASAALRTPDTARSPRGADWVGFAPAAIDQHAIDRATAWLVSAWRRADGES